jgi:flagellar basal-body rod protein FlgB
LGGNSCRQAENFAGPWRLIYPDFRRLSDIGGLARFMQKVKHLCQRMSESPVNKLDNALGFHATALGLRAQRQQILAGNIANADTPHYKARDLDFGSALASAMSGRGPQALPMATTTAGHLSAQGAVGPHALMYRQASQNAVDGNTVDMDIERAQFAENAVHYEASINFLSGQLRSMLDAIQAGGR